MNQQDTVYVKPEVRGVNVNSLTNNTKDSAGFTSEQLDNMVKGLTGSTYEQAKDTETNEIIRLFENEIPKLNLYEILFYIIQHKSIYKSSDNEGVDDNFINSINPQNINQKLIDIIKYSNIHSIGELAIKFLPNNTDGVNYNLIDSKKPQSIESTIKEDSQEILKTTYAVLRSLTEVSEEFRNDESYQKLSGRVQALNFEVNEIIEERDLTEDEIAKYKKDTKDLQDEITLLENKLRTEAGKIEYFRKNPIENADTKAELDKEVYEITGKHLEDFAVLDRYLVDQELPDRAIEAILNGKAKGYFHVADTTVFITIDGKIMYLLSGLDTEKVTEIDLKLRALKFEDSFMPSKLNTQPDMELLISKMTVQDYIEVLNYISEPTPNLPIGNIANYISQLTKTMDRQSIVFYLKRILPLFNKDSINKYIETIPEVDRASRLESINNSINYANSLMIFDDIKTSRELITPGSNRDAYVYMTPSSAETIQKSVQNAIGLGGRGGDFKIQSGEYLSTLSYYLERKKLLSVKYLLLILEETMIGKVKEYRGADFNFNHNYPRLFEEILAKFPNNPIISDELNRIKRNYVNEKKQMGSSIPEVWGRNAA